MTRSNWREDKVHSLPGCYFFLPHFPCGCRSLNETFNCEGGNNEIRMPFLSCEIWGHISSLTAFAKTNSDAAINWKNVKRGMLESKLVFMNVCNYFSLHHMVNFFSYQDWPRNSYRKKRLYTYCHIPREWFHESDLANYSMKSWISG